MIRQLSILEDVEEELRTDGIKYAARAIYKCSGHRGRLISVMKNGDRAAAFQEFRSPFTTFGFASNGYWFSGRGTKADIRNEGLHFESTVKEMFEALWSMWESGELD